MWHRLSSAGAPEAIAVDLGTARTRISVPGEGIYLDEPTVLAFDRRGQPVAAGWDAWHASVEGPATLRYPVRHGHIVDPVLCVQYLKALLGQAGLLPSTAVAIAVPALSVQRDIDVLIGCVKAATGADPIVVDAGVAAASSSESASAGPQDAHLVCDLGAGLIQVSAAWQGRLRASARADVGAHEYMDNPTLVLGFVIAAVCCTLEQLGEETADVLAARPLQLIGGGALLPALAYDIAELCGSQVQVPDDPRSRVIDGLTAQLSGKLTAA